MKTLCNCGKSAFGLVRYWYPIGGRATHTFCRKECLERYLRSIGRRWMMYFYNRPKLFTLRGGPPAAHLAVDHAPAGRSEKANA